MNHITKHSKVRIVERVDIANNFNEAKRVAKQAWISGNTINKYQNNQDFFFYLQKKRDQSRDCTIRVYRDNIFIWRGRTKKLVTAHPVPKRFKEVG